MSAIHTYSTVQRHSYKQLMPDNLEGAHPPIDLVTGDLYEIDV